MRRLILILALSLLPLGCGGLNLKPLPPAPVTVADTEVRRYVAKSVVVLDSLGDVTADLSRVERELHDKGSIPDALHVQLRAGITAVSKAGLAALDRLDAGVTAWSQVKALLDPLIDGVNHLIALVNSAPSKVKSSLGGFLDDLSGALGEALFGGAR